MPGIKWQWTAQLLLHGDIVEEVQIYFLSSGYYHFRAHTMFDSAYTVIFTRRTK